MRVYGVDFTSRPTRRKPLTCAVCELEGDVLSFLELRRWSIFEEFEAMLGGGGPWIAGLDFPFGQADKFVGTIGWPTSWHDYVLHAASLGRAGFRSALDAYRAGREDGDKEHRRAFDVYAGSISPQKLYGVPVGLMFFEGAARLASSGVTIPGLMQGDPSRTVFEAYPGVAAQSLVGRRSYKNDQVRKQTPEHRAVRVEMLVALTGDRGFELYGLRVLAPVELCEDPGADELDALICAVQAAWGWQNLDMCQAALNGTPPHEGWIADPALFTKWA